MRRFLSAGAVLAILSPAVAFAQNGVVQGEWVNDHWANQYQIQCFQNGGQIFAIEQTNNVRRWLVNGELRQIHYKNLITSNEDKINISQGTTCTFVQLR